MDQSVETMMQLDAQAPLYNIKRIQFVDVNKATAASLSEALQDAARIWLPHKQVVPAPVFWANQRRRLLEVSPWVVRQHRRVKKLSYKKHHGIIRNRRLNYEGNVRPFIWRNARCLEPPPLMVYKETGATADYQLPARPFYQRGVSHSLFPVGRTGFPGMRVTRDGRFVGLNKHPRHTDAQPKPKQN
eukprot:GHVS01025826.1.p1 GENE.GHVS01025826.1~~GHVS01025826.1.p1  ORF type:complete len:207 (-),score=23.91 GHVS01025826.1:100-660(-)